MWPALELVIAVLRSLESDGQFVTLSRMLTNSFTSRLLKKVQMQGGARCEARGVLTRTSQRRASAPTRQMGLFQQPARLSEGVARGKGVRGDLTGDTNLMDKS